MTFVLAVLAALGAFVVSWAVLSIALGLIANLGQFFRLLVFVPPYRTISRGLVLLVAVWIGVQVFGAVTS